jgi:hypothetical protein
MCTIPTQNFQVPFYPTSVGWLGSLADRRRPADSSKSHKRRAYLPTEAQVLAATSALRDLPRRKSINRKAALYYMKKWCEVVSGQYISAPAMLIAAERIGLKMRRTQPTGQTASVNLTQRGVDHLHVRAQEILRGGR